MTLRGTDRYDEWTGHVPDLVRQAVANARTLDFPLCVHPGTGALLATLAQGVAAGGTVVETGTGTGAGLAWMVTAADPSTTFISVELDEARAASAQALFAPFPNVTVHCGSAEDHWYEHRPDLLVLDGGGGAGKTGDVPIDPTRALAPRGTITVDDFSPIDCWPPVYQGEPDACRLHWLEHPALLTTEIAVAPDMAVLVGRLLR